MSEAVFLGGTDVFHLVHDRAMQRLGVAGNQCALALELYGRLDVDSLARKVARAEALVPHLSVRLEAGLLRRARWVPGPPLGRDRVRLVPSDGDVLASVERLFAERATSDERPWELVVLRGPLRDAVLLPWFHSYTDAKGAERLARWLGAGEGDDLEALPSGEELVRVRPRALEGLDLRARAALARAYNEHILRFAQTPFVSLAGAARGRPLGKMHFSRLNLSLEDSAALDRSIRARAKLAESGLMLLSAARMVDGALRRRGFASTQHMIPVPLSLDPKAGSARMFGNHITMMMFSLRRDDLADERRALATLAEQQRAIVRDKLDLAMAAALELVSVLPPRAYLGLATLPFGGEMSSLVLSNPGALSLDRFAGVPVLDAYPLPAVVPSPGIEVIFSRYRGRFSATVGTYEGLVPRSEAVAMAASLRAELFGEGDATGRGLV
jgi:hypothetical protein